LAVNTVAVATPLAFVVACVVPVLLANVPLAPVCAGAVNVTTIPWMGLLDASNTVTPSGVPKAADTCADCGVVPVLAVICVAGPAVLVRLNVAAGAGPAVTVTVKFPTFVFAVNVPAFATPAEVVFSVIVFELFENVPLWPFAPAIAVKVTGEFGITWPPESFTVTDKGDAKAVPICVDCVAPELIVTEAGVAAVTVILAVVLGTFGATVLAVIVAVPGPAPVTGTVTLVAFVANATETGTVATLVLLEARVMIRPAGAGADRLSMRF
jgi:hypothetical protein